MNLIGKITLLLLFTFSIVFAGGVVYIYLIFSGIVSFYGQIIIMICAGAIFFTANGLFQWIKKRNTMKLAITYIIILLLAIGVNVGTDMYKESLATVDQELDVTLFQPFENENTIAKLDDQSNLQLSNDLPKLDGATALYPLYAGFAQATYPEKTYPTDRGEVIVSTTPDAYKNLINGKVDIIFAAGPSQRQIQEAERAGIEFQLTPIGREAFVFFVNANNSIDDLSIEQIQSIYSGAITNWSEVGGGNGKILAFQRPDDSGSQTALENLMGDIPLTKAPSEAIISGMGEIIQEVSHYTNYRNAIGYSFRYYSMELIRNDEIKHIAINGVYPDKETIRSGEYPISSEFYAITTNTDNPNVEKFLEWILSEQGQWLVEETGYVPVHN